MCCKDEINSARKAVGIDRWTEILDTFGFNWLRFCAYHPQRDPISGSC